MNDPYSVLGISRSADDETIKKAYRQKCKEFHPDLHPNDPTCEDKFKEVQAAYSEVMRQKSGGGTSGSYGSSQSGGYSAYGQQYQGQNGYGGQQYQNPFTGFGFGPFGFGFYSSSSGNGYSGYSNYGYSGRQNTGSPELQAAGNYIRNGYYQEALNVLNNMPSSDRTAVWHYYAALANSGLGNNTRAQEEARTAVNMEPGNYEYQNLLNRLQNGGRNYSAYQQQYSQPGGGMGSYCLRIWLYMAMCNIFSLLCCGRPGAFFIC